MNGISLNIGDVVHYGAHGVCRVSGVERMDLGAGKKNYFLMQPVAGGSIQLYLPQDADPERVHLRKVLSAEEIYALVEQEIPNHMDWVNDSKVRKELASKTLRGGDTAELIRMVKVLHRHGQELPQGKSLPLSDLEQMRSAEKQLFNEFCFVLDITQEQVLPFIMGEIKIPKK